MTMSSRAHVAHSLNIGTKRDITRYLVPAGRSLFALIFLVSVPGHFSRSDIAYAAQNGVPAPGLLVPLAGLLALVGGLCVALGYYTRFGAVLLALFLIPVTLMMHKFWGISDPKQVQIQQIMFMKNVSMLGATFLLMHFGAGPISLDAREVHSNRPPPL